MTPSNSPSNAPTLLPSVSPTKAPTWLPSNPPSFSPSPAPTISPTNLPTYLPTNAPTSAPTYLSSTAPSAAPSDSPTACVDKTQAITTTSNDGMDIIAPKTLELSRIFSKVNISEFSININESNYHDFVPLQGYVNCDGIESICFIDCTHDNQCHGGNVADQDIIIDVFIMNCIGNGKCSDTTVNISRSDIEQVHFSCKELSCVAMDVHFTSANITSLQIECLGSESCAGMEIHLLNTQIGEMILLCDSTDACSRMIYIAHNSTINETILICNDIHSCDSISMDIQGSFHILSVHCIARWSCNKLLMNIHANIESKVFVDCFEDNSCDGLNVKYLNSFLDINMYNHSENVLIQHPMMENINLTCGNPNDHRFIRYNIDEIMTIDQWRDRGRNKYDSNHFPCDGITIDCTIDPYFKKSCQYEYVVNTLTLSDILGLKAMLHHSVYHHRKLNFHDENMDFEREILVL